MEPCIMWLFLAVTISTCSISNILGQPVKYSSSCSVELCSNSVSSNNNFPPSSVCYKFRTSSNATVCAPQVDCSLFDACTNGTQCGTNSSVCVVNSCCSTPICMPLALSSMCKQSQQSNSTVSRPIFNISLNATWSHEGVTVAGGNGQGSGLNQLASPHNVYVDDDQNVYVVDYGNHRIVEWERGATSGQVIAAGNGEGNGMHQLSRPTDMFVDKEKGSLYICDNGNKRVVQWSHREGKNGQPVISGFPCWGLTMDDYRFLYASDIGKHDVKQWRMGNTSVTIVAGGNGKGDRLNQLSFPMYVFVDRDQSVYVSERDNHRVVKWMKGANQSIVVAGGRGKGNSLRELHYPHGVVVDRFETVYVADWENDRIVRWPKGATQGDVIAGGNGRGVKSNQFDRPVGLYFDRHNNLYVADRSNDRVQKFFINPTSSS